MLQIFSEIQQRLSSWAVVPDKRFRTQSGAGEQEESIKSKVREYWTGESVFKRAEFKRFNPDISGFDPRNPMTNV